MLTKDPKNPEVGSSLKNKDLIHATQKAQVHSTLHLPKVHYKACSLHPVGEEWEGEKAAVLIRTQTKRVPLPSSPPRYTRNSKECSLSLSTATPTVPHYTV